MKSRDAAIVVDHRRQGVVAPPPSKGDEQARKKKAPPPKQQTSSSQKQPNSKQPQGAAITTGALVAQSQATTTKKATTPAAASTTAKKNAGKQQTKATKKEKQNAKNAAAKDVTTATTAATATPSASASTSSATTAKQQQQRTNEQTLDPDSLKSRNHTLFLAPSGSSASSSKLLPSWGCSRKESATHSVTERLHTEILEYAQYTRSTVEDMAVHIELMITNVRMCVRSLWPHSNVETFGSYSTGIWLPSSDVDLVILDVVEVNDAVITVKNLRRLAKTLEAQAWVHSLVLLDTAKIPVLKLVSADTRVPIDITFESSSTHSGLIARDLIKRYADELPELYPLAVVFKQLLRERDLNDAYTGGLSSYSIVLMIIHFAQLWRNGEKCFLAASIYASGSLPPAPAALAAEAARLAALDTKVSGSPTKATSGSIAQVSKAGKASTPTEVGSPVKAAPLTPTSSYAAIVSRPKALKRSVSEAGGKNSSDSNNGPSESQPVQRFSYAAVAAGIVKVSEDDASRSKKAAPAAASTLPSSYAAAVAAAAGSKSSAAATRSSSATKASATGGSATDVSSSASVSGNSDTQLDSASVTSSNADTEDSSSSCSSSSAADSDDESSRQQQQPPVQRCVCLGEHTMMLLEFFGIIFDYRKNGISIRDGGYIYRLADHGSDIGKPALVIEDPIHPDRNVSASSFAFSKVVAVFEDSFYALKYHRPSKFAPSALSCLLSASGHTSHTTKGAISR